MDLLARREHSRKELRDKLRRKGYENEVVTPVIEQLEKDGLLSDARFAEAYLAFRSRRGFGPRRLYQELEQRGIDSHIVTKALNEEPLNWLVLIEKVWQKRFGKLPSNLSEKAKQYSFLQYRGFDESLIKTLFAGLSATKEID